jgi:hypothetical protein
MEMDKVELFVVTFPAHALQHHHMEGVRVANRAVETQRPRPSGV